MTVEMHKYKAQFENFAHLRFKAYFIDFFVFSGTVGCEQLKVLVKLDYTK